MANSNSQEFTEGKVFVVVKEVDHLPYSGAMIEFGEAERSKILAPIQLQAGKETYLETVQIVSKLPLVERKIDRTIMQCRCDDHGRRWHRDGCLGKIARGFGRSKWRNSPQREKWCRRFHR